MRTKKETEADYLNWEKGQGGWGTGVGVHDLWWQPDPWPLGGTWKLYNSDCLSFLLWQRSWGTCGHGIAGRLGFQGPWVLAEHEHQGGSLLIAHIRNRSEGSVS